MDEEFTALCYKIEELSKENPEDVYAFIQEAYRRQINLQQQS